MCYFLSEYLPCGEGGRSNGPHCRFVCVLVNILFGFIFLCMLGPCVLERVCVCVCLHGSVCRKDQVVDYLFRELHPAVEFTCRAMTQTEGNNPSETPMTSAISLLQHRLDM